MYDTWCQSDSVPTTTPFGLPVDPDVNRMYVDVRLCLPAPFEPRVQSSTLMDLDGPLEPAVHAPMTTLIAASSSIDFTRALGNVGEMGTYVIPAERIARHVSVDSTDRSIMTPTADPPTPQDDR